MATIYEKLPVDKCVVLDSREALVYPFDVGYWEQLRVSVAASIVNATGFNERGTDENIGTAWSDKDMFAFGIKDGSDNFPYYEGGAFAGVCMVNGTNSNIDTFGIYTSRSILISGGSALSNSALPSNRLRLAIRNEVANTTSYAQDFHLKIERTGSYYYNTTLDANSNNGGATTDVSTQYLRTRSRSANYSNKVFGQLPATGMDNFFIYLPFFNDRLRIHNVVVEKFA